MQISIFRDIFDSNKVTHSCLKCPTIDPWLKQKFPILNQIGIWTFLNVFSASICRHFTKTWYRHKQISIFQDIFGCNKVTHSCLKCPTIDPWLKLKFSKLYEIGILTFFSVFSTSKYLLSPRL